MAAKQEAPSNSMLQKISGLVEAIDDRFVRDNLRTSTWLLLGASIQSLILLVTVAIIGKDYRHLLYIVLPAIVFLTLRITEALLMAFGYKQNQYMRGVKQGKWTAQIPDENGQANKPAERPVVAFLLGFSVNHPLGLLAPGFKDTVDFAQAMFADLEKHKGTNGFLGQTYWTEISQTSNNAILSLSYWSSVEDLHAFARGDTHRVAWNWWNATIKKHSHLGIMHEVYEAPRGGWENVYINFRPTALAATKHYVKSSADSDSTNGKFVDPLYDASKGKWRSSAGRFGRSMHGAEIDEFGDPYPS